MQPNKQLGNILSTQVVGVNRTRGFSENMRHTTPSMPYENRSSVLTNNYISQGRKSETFRRTVGNATLGHTTGLENQRATIGHTTGLENHRVYSKNSPTFTTSAPSYKPTNMLRQGVNTNITRNVSKSNFNVTSNAVRTSVGLKKDESKNSNYTTISRNVTSNQYSTFNNHNSSLRSSVGHRNTPNVLNTNVLNTRVSAGSMPYSGVLRKSETFTSGQPVNFFSRKEGNGPIVMSKTSSVGST